MIDFQPGECDLGQRLKQVRERNGLSQRELARRAGVTNSNISMIEQGAVSPTVSSLTRLLDAIPLSLAQFFALDPEHNAGSVYRAAELQPSACPNRGIDCTVLPAKADGAAVNLRRYRFSPGTDTGAEFRAERAGIVGWLLEGTLELALGARVVTLATGDGFYLPGGQPYRVRNTAQASALVVTVNSGSTQLISGAERLRHSE